MAVQPGLDAENRELRQTGRLEDQVHLHLRKSMRKFNIPRSEAQGAAVSAMQDAAREVFGVVDISKPYKYGFFNTQVLCWRVAAWRETPGNLGLGPWGCIARLAVHPSRY